MKNCMSSRAAWPALAGLIALLLSFPVQTAFGQAAVLTQHNDNFRTGANLSETTLTPTNVNVLTFGKLFTRALDANVNGQVLYVPNVTIKGAVHNVIYAYTSNNANNSPCSLWAFDADDPKASQALWQHPFTNSAQWTTCTPVIDPSTNTIYVLTKDNDDNGDTNLRAIDITSGVEKPGSPIKIAASVPGTGDGSVGGVVSFDTSHANCRPGLLLLGGVVYCAFAHNSDSFPYHGWIFGYKYNGTSFAQTGVFCTNPNGGDAGIWQAAKGLAADGNGNIYCAVGNGTFDADSGGSDYGMCYLKLNALRLTVSDWFAPFDEKTNSDNDLDLGGAGVLGINGTDRIFGGGTKFGSVFLLDSTNMGHFTPNGPDKVVQRFDNATPNDSVGQDAVSWAANSISYVYLWANGGEMQQFKYDSSVNQFNPAGVYKQSSGMTAGGSLTVTANDFQNGILWAVAANGIFYAFDATDVTKELWDSNQYSTRDKLPNVGHFQFPTVVNGKAYVATNSASIVAYGLLPTAVSPVADTYVQDGASANTNFGTNKLLLIRSSGTANSGYNRDTYLQFDTTIYSTINSAKLRVYGALNASGSMTATVYSTSGSWTETGLTWNNKPALGSAHGGLTVSGTSNAFYEVDLTSYVQSQRAAGHRIISIALHDPTTTSQTMLFNSKEAGSNPPQLVVNSN